MSLHAGCDCPNCTEERNLIVKAVRESVAAEGSEFVEGFVEAMKILHGGAQHEAEARAMARDAWSRRQRMKSDG